MQEQDIRIIVLFAFREHIYSSHYQICQYQFYANKSSSSDKFAKNLPS